MRALQTSTSSAQISAQSEALRRVQQLTEEREKLRLRRQEIIYCKWNPDSDKCMHIALLLEALMKAISSAFFSHTISFLFQRENLITHLMLLPLDL